ncbi:MAG TPA: right-handed parallel beta-helix repeat-containing protein [Chloroflexota bacterium]|nr:right-handed parallel beta-helix repeat-containing protein [Chloroflexota bacterium]
MRSVSTIRRSTFIILVVSLAGFGFIPSTPSVDAAAATSETTGRSHVCGNTDLLSGPTTMPAGAVRVDPGQNVNEVTQSNPPGTTFWLAAGTHTLGPSEFGQIIPKDNNVYVGAPGAIIDGKHVNRYAFTQNAANVTIKYLTVTGFVAPLNEGVVNQSAGSGWTIERNTVIENEGAGVFVGPGNMVRQNCLKDNGQYGASMYKPQVQGASAITNIVLEGNEVAGNNTGNWEAKIPGCGCAGGVKFWDVAGAKVVNNWVHHNRGVGLWADTNNVDFHIEGNVIEYNDHVGLWYEISYNALIRDNVFRRNAITEGERRAAAGDNFPIGAIYLAEAGGDSRLPAPVTGTSTLDITDNLFEDNWGGVVVWEAAERFCNSPGNTSGTYCTKVNANVTLESCNAVNISKEPWYSDCRWKSQNVKVHDNDFRHNAAALGNCSPVYCGRMAIIASWGTAYPLWSPYLGTTIQERITFASGNVWSNNTYTGTWRFTPYDTSRNVDFAAWQAAPYNQDAGSTLDGVNHVGPPPETAVNHIDGDTATLEGGTGYWVDWYNSSPARSKAQAHSGSASLLVEVIGTAYGVTLANWPGFEANEGNKRVSLWVRADVGEHLDPVMRVHWRNAVGGHLQVDEVAIPALTTRWQHVFADVVAPMDTARMTVELVSAAGRPGDSFYVDDVFVGDR